MKHKEESPSSPALSDDSYEIQVRRIEEPEATLEEENIAILKDIKSPIKAVLFGIDGMIRNINELNYKVWSEILMEYGYELSYQDYLQWFLFEHEANVLFFLLPYSTIDDHIEISKKKQMAFINHINHSDFVLSLGALRGIEKFLETIKKKNEHKGEEDHEIMLGVVSDLSNKETKSLLTKLKLMDYFDVILSSYGLKKPKPDPSIYQVALEQLKIEPNEVVVFEGTTQGCLSAVRALKNGNIIGVKSSDLSEEIDLKEMNDNGVQTIIENFEGLEFSHVEMMLN
ncbi:predicted protein [Naegleria gruberi]|uniref:Predicted protein n=1 Tax=Naegleria gruberi TaxID=5762 RepID=D2VCS1_NAEGR|nr:uncharacterized protein NAEGRDRAFT_48496 [Naegleria gruberi]EFC45467.1 predicted protein [Naegleria gruberi]|eukprot:XP_002678211.1 predicted protein [Naegleria gruberi strain NEG-M]